MKKLICILMVCVFLFSALTIPVFADEVYDPFGKLYLDRFVEKYEIYMSYSPGHSVYVENYFHRVDPDNPESEIDWVFVYGYMFCDSFTIDYISRYAVIGEKWINAKGDYFPFPLKYAIYDVKKDIFIDIVDVNLDEYEGLEEYINTNKKIGLPVGDADRDKVLSVMDATTIQMALAYLCESYVFVEVEGEALNEELVNVSDFDRDGQVSVLDATAIQLKLAGLEQ